MDEKKQYLYQLRLVPHLLKEENWTEKENKIVSEHFNHLKALTEEGVVIIAGRTLNMDDEGFGIVIFEAETELEARKMMEADPAVADGVMTAKLYPYSVALMRK
jgi:uncharacterized protein